MVACGRDFSLVLLNDGRVLSCGADDYGQLALGKGERFEPDHAVIRVCMLTCFHACLAARLS